MSGIIHVGGWLGIEYRDWSPDRKLIVFEPQAGNFAQLEANLGGRPNVELVHAAVGAEPGTATLHVFDPSHSSSLLEPKVTQFATSEIDEIRYVGTEEVTVTTLDATVNGRNGFDTLRIDTQGYELEVLRGATETLKRIERVELELHDPETYAGAAVLVDLDAFLTAHGFMRTGLDIEHSDGLGDAVYERSGQ